MYTCYGNTVYLYNSISKTAGAMIRHRACTVSCFFNIDALMPIVSLFGTFAAAWSHSSRTRCARRIVQCMLSAATCIWAIHFPDRFWVSHHGNV